MRESHGQENPTLLAGVHPMHCKLTGEETWVEGVDPGLEEPEKTGRKKPLRAVCRIVEETTQPGNQWRSLPVGVRWKTLAQGQSLGDG